MKNWRETLVGADAPLRAALSVIDAAASRMALIVDEAGRLLGTLTDGDVRRALLAGESLESPSGRVMERKPTVARDTDPIAIVFATMRRGGFLQMPIVDVAGRVVGLETIDDYPQVPIRDNWVVIMAGGLGTRLKERTVSTPKPMLPVGDRPLLETIIRTYAEQGFVTFYLSVNYRAEQIEAHFGDGSDLGISVRYLREQEPLGTAGALKLLPHRPSCPLVVTNADLLTRPDFGLILEQHERAESDATMVVRDYKMPVPFGVVTETDGAIVSLEEKPVRQFTVNAGIYVLSPEALAFVPSAPAFDMPALFHELLAAGRKVRSHRLDGYWLDIGREADYAQANLEFATRFR